MKFLKRKGFEETTVRKVVNDEKTEVFGVVGTIGDLLKVGILEYCDYERDAWCYIPKHGNGARFGNTREEATEGVNA